MMRVLLDTNVVLDYLLARDPFAQIATEILLAAENVEFEPFVSAITPVNLYYIARKLRGDAEARKAVKGLLAICQIAITDRAILFDALALPMKDYEDAVQTASARAVSLDAIVTRNLDDYANADFSILTPAEFLTQLRVLKSQDDN